MSEDLIGGAQLPKQATYPKLVDHDIREVVGHITLYCDGLAIWR